MENTIILNSEQKIEVLFQDEVSLDIDCSLRYIESGKKEIDSYTNNSIKPELDDIVSEAQTDLASQIAQGIEDAAQAAETSATEAINSSIAEAKQDIATYVSTNITPDLDEALAQAQQYSQSASSASSSCAQSALQASNSATSAAQSAQEASSTASTFDAHVTEKQTAFDSHVAEKQSAFDTNAASKTNTFNTNATSKTSAFNDNYTSKLNAFNSNASTKQALVDASVDEAEQAENNSKIWAEGTDAQVQALGGTKSAKGWADSLDTSVFVKFDTNNTFTGINTFTNNVTAPNLANVDLSNVIPAQSFKDMSIGWGIADRTAGIDISSSLSSKNSSWTPPANGMISALVLNNNYVYVYTESGCNSTDYSKTDKMLININGENYIFISAINFVEKDVPIYAASDIANNGKIYFYPFKGANNA